MSFVHGKPRTWGCIEQSHRPSEVKQENKLAYQITGFQGMKIGNPFKSQGC
jgi:hypothetical protein